MGMHLGTPKVAAYDPRGATIRTIDYWRAVEQLPVEPRINRTARDAAGRAVEHWDARLWALQMTDPLAPANLKVAYSLSAIALHSVSVDAGTQIELPGLAGQRIVGWDSRKTRQDIEYDTSLRAIAIFEQGVSTPRRCVERSTFGHPGSGDQAHNQFGRLIRQDDRAGSVLLSGYSITAECIADTRHFTVDPVIPAWPQPIADRQSLLEPGAGATTKWRYGPLGHVLEQTDAKDNCHTFALTIDGHLRERRLQLSGQSGSQVLVCDIEYNADGQVTREVAGNGVQTTLGYQRADGRLLKRHAEDANGRVLQHLLYGHDRMGNVLWIEDQVLPVRHFANRKIDSVSRFFYDSLYQLIEATGWEAGAANQGPASAGRVDPAAISNYRQIYTYDFGGNMLRLAHVGAQAQGRDLQAARYSNRCLRWRNGTPPTEEQIQAVFDANGNLLELDPGRLLTWNLQNQLHEVTPVTRTSAENDRERYFYNSSRQRVRKIREQLTNARTVVAEVRYLPALELHTDSATGERLQVIIAEAGLNNVRILHWESPPPLANNQFRYSCTDSLGSISLELAQDARIISRQHFYPFGDTSSLDGDANERKYKFARYSGKPCDATGMYDFGYRFYIPWLQRWLNPDPKGFIDGPNLYCMVGNSPVTYLDPDGGGKTEAAQLREGVAKQQALLTTVSTAVADTRNSLMNHMFARQRFQALGRRVGTQLASSAVNAGGSALGAAGGTALGGLLGPVGATLGAKAGEKVGSMAASSLVSKVVDAFQLDRAINFKGTEMNPKAFIEGVEPKATRSLATIRFDLAAFDPRTTEGRARLGNNLMNGAIDKIGGKLGSEAPGLIRTGIEFFHASRGLNAAALSETHEQTPTVIDMLEFRTQAIKDELAGTGSADPQVFEDVAQLSVQTPQVVQALHRSQDLIELIAPSPYAGNRQSLKGRDRAKSPVRRQQTHV